MIIKQNIHTLVILKMKIKHNLCNGAHLIYNDRKYVYYVIVLEIEPDRYTCILSLFIQCKICYRRIAVRYSRQLHSLLQTSLSCRLASPRVHNGFTSVCTSGNQSSVSVRFSPQISNISHPFDNAVVTCKLPLWYLRVVAYLTGSDQICFPIAVITNVELTQFSYSFESKTYDNGNTFEQRN